MLSNDTLINNRIKNLIVFTFIFFTGFIVLRMYFKPFFIIAFLYIVMKPAYNKIIKEKYKYRKLYAATLIIIINITFFLIIFYMGAHIYNLLLKLTSLNILPAYDYLEKVINIVTNNSQDLIKVMLGDYSAIIRQGAISTGEGLVAYIIANISVYFLLVDENLFKNIIKKLLPGKIYNSIIKNYFIFKKYFAIELILILLCTLITMIGFTFLRIKNSVSLGILCGILDVLPYVGTIIVFIPLIIYNIIMKRYFVAIALLFVYIIVQVIREVLEAKYISNSFSLHPLAVLISMYLGVKFFGMLGVIAGPIFCLFAKDILVE